MRIARFNLISRPPTVGDQSSVRPISGRSIGVAKYQAVGAVIESVTATESARCPIIALYESLADRHSLVNRSYNCWVTVARLSYSFVVEVPDKRATLTARGGVTR